MSTALSTDVLVSSRASREQHISRVDVLDKVKSLTMLADDVHATVDLVAAYYEVPVDTIKSLVKHNRDELESDGYRLLTGAALRSIKDLSGVAPSVRSLGVFPRRAILRVGMLLRDSPVAVRVRDYLLRAEAGLPDLNTVDGQIELTSRLLENLLARQKAEALAAVQAKELETARPKAQYVDHFTNPDDANTIGVLAAQLCLKEAALRTYLVDRGVIYKKPIGSRWSASQYRVIEEYEWRARAGYLGWFSLKDHPEVRRFYNGQIRTTLYVTPAGKVGVENLLLRYPIAE